MIGKLSKFKSVSFVSIGSLINAILGFIFLTGVAKHLPLEDFGKYALLTSLLTLLSRVLDFGTNSLYVSETETGKFRLNEFLAVKIILAIFAIPLSILILQKLNFKEFEIIVAFVLGMLAYGISYFLYPFYQKTQQYLQIVLLNFLPSIVKGLFGIALFFGILDFGLFECLLIFGTSIFMGIFVYLIWPFDLGVIDIKFTHVTSYLKKTLSPGTSQLIYESWQTVNNILTKIFNTFSDVGIFSMANKISNIFSIISFAVFTVLLPKNTERKKKEQGYDFKESLILTIVLLIMSVLAIIGSRIFLLNALGNKFEESLKYLGILILASALNAIQNFTENYFYVHEKTNYLVKVNGIKLIMLIAISATLIPNYGLYSLAAANFIAALFGIITIYSLIYKFESKKVI